MSRISGRMSQLRQDYQKASLHEEQAGDDPVLFFEKWFTEALSADEAEPNAMTLSTVDNAGNPHSRIVLLKGLDHGSFVFFTNYQSNKGRQINEDQRVALNFFWPALERQVRVEGIASQIDASASDAYFNQRPEESRIGAMASPQSRVIESREWLESRVAALKAEVGKTGIKRPDYWGGFAVLPHKIEFWQGRSNRLHDRIVFEKAPGSQSWKKYRIAP